MKENANEVPLLDLTPKLKRPLSLWNPLDYLRLLFWVFFFPQAIRWYVETFGNPDYRNIGVFKNFKKFRKLWVGDPIRKKLILQTLVIILIAAPGICLILRGFNVPIFWGALTFGTVLGVVGVVKFDETGGVALGVVGGVATSVTLGVGLGVMGGVTFRLVGGFGAFVAFFVGFFVVFLVVIAEVAVVALGMLGGVPLGVARIMTLGVVGGVAFGSVFSIVFGMAAFALIIRISEYFLTTLYLIFSPSAKKTKFLPHLGLMIFLPVPGIQKQLENQLNANWETGIQNANQLLAYSLQFIPVVKAINIKLEQSSRNIVLARVSALAIKPFDWKLIPALSEKLIPLCWKVDLIPRLDTPARAGCAGFWFWHNKESAEAVEAFSIVRDLPHGPEVYRTARTIDKGFNASDMQTIAAIEDETNWLDSLPDPELRPGTLKALRMLHSVAGEARVVLNARAPLNRSTAINRAVADLTNLVETGNSFCPEPEWPLIQDIAQQWKEIFTREGGVIGEEVLRQPVPNPYEGYSGLPVTGPSFTGRTGIMSQIETHWAIGGPMPALILYGHRRMGKTSVLRSLAKNTDPNNLYVYLDMQNAGWVEHTGQLFLNFAEAVHKAVSTSGLDTGPVPDRANYSDLDIARRSFNALLERIDKHMTETKRLVLAIDEFELIEQGIRDQRIDPGLLPYLRSINQQYRWLGLIFAGLHTLDEMGHDYHSAFYGQAHYLRLGYLTCEDALKLITQPHPDFALEYEDALIDEIYRLTFGQPYLVQLLCWELVNRWNDRFLEKGESTPRILKLDDLAPVLTPDFYQGAGYYFEGVWGNATENEQRLMRIIAKYENKPLSQQELAAEAIKSGFPKEPQIMEETLEFLSRHDIIASKETGIGFASELMRRWVHRQKS